MRTNQQFKQWISLGVLILVLSACPVPDLVSSGPQKTVKRAEYTFWNPVMERGVNAVILYPSGKYRQYEEKSCPLMLLIPGFADTSFGLEYLGRALVQAGFYVVIPDPEDVVNILPQGEEVWWQTHFPELVDSLNHLQTELLTAGYQVDAVNTTQMLQWLFTSLGGEVTDHTALLLAQEVFDYRLSDHEAIIMDCLNKMVDLPSKELIRNDCVFVGGHSLGGFNSLQLAGASGRSQLPEGLVKAALMMAPATGFFHPDDVAMVKVPTLWLKAGLDEPEINEPLDKLYPFCPEPKRLKIYPQFTHLAFSDTTRIILGDDRVAVWREKQIVATVVKFFTREYQKFLHQTTP